MRYAHAQGGGARLSRSELDDLRLQPFPTVGSVDTHKSLRDFAPRDC